MSPCTAPTHTSTATSSHEERGKVHGSPGSFYERFSPGLVMFLHLNLHTHTTAVDYGNAPPPSTTSKRTLKLVVNLFLAKKKRFLKNSNLFFHGTFLCGTFWCAIENGVVYLPYACVLSLVYRFVLSDWCVICISGLVGCVL